MIFWYAALDSFLSIEPAIIGSYLFTFGGWSHKTTASCHTGRISSIQRVSAHMQSARLRSSSNACDKFKTCVITIGFVFHHLVCGDW